MLSRFYAWRRGLSPIDFRTGRRVVLEFPRAVVDEVLDGAVPAPVDRLERALDPRAGDAVARDALLVEVVHEEPVRLRGQVRREAVDLAVREAVAAEEVRGRLPLGVEALLADVEAVRHDVLGPDVRAAVGARAQRVLVRRVRRAEVALRRDAARRCFERNRRGDAGGARCSRSARSRRSPGARSSPRRSSRSRRA